MLLPLIAVLTLAGLVVAGTGAAVSLPERRERRDQERQAREAQEQEEAADAEARRTANQPPTHAEQIRLHGFGPMVRLWLEQASRNARELRRRIEDATRHRDETQEVYDAEAKTLLEGAHRGARFTLVALFMLAWLVATYLLFQLEVGIIGLLLPDVGSLRYALALIAVLITTGLGLLIVERLRPTGAIPSWKTQTWQQRLPAAMGMLVVFAGLLIFYASLASVRSETVLGPKLSNRRAACVQARATDPNGVTAQAACDGARNEANRFHRAQNWDQAAAVLAPTGELVFGGFAFEGLLILQALRIRRRLVRAEEDERAANRALDDAEAELADGLTAAGLEAGLGPDDVRLSLAAELQVDQTPAIGTGDDDRDDDDGGLGSDAGVGGGRPPGGPDVDADALPMPPVTPPDHGPADIANPDVPGDDPNSPLGTFGPPAGPDLVGATPAAGPRLPDVI